MTIHDANDLRPTADDHTHHSLTDAVELLGVLRGFPESFPHDFLADPGLRLHLLASLRHQLHHDLLDAIQAAHHHGYTLNEIIVLIDPL